MPKSKEQFEAMKDAAVEKINRAGLRLFVEKGVGTTNIRDIAEKAGISMGLMYHYYESKERLYIELIKTAVIGANEAMEQLQLNPVSPKEKIELFTARMLSELGQKDPVAPYYFLLMTHAMMNRQLSDIAGEFLEMASESLHTLRLIIEQGQALGQVKGGDPMSLTLMYMSVYVGLCSYKLMGMDSFVLPEAAWINGILIQKEI